MKKKIRRKKRGPVRANKVTFDGIKFASGLEKYMYIALKKLKYTLFMKVQRSQSKMVLTLI